MAIGSDVVVASTSAVPAGPCIVASGRATALVYLDASDGALHVLALDEEFAAVREEILAPPAGHVVVGSPTLALEGMELALAWETRDDVGAAIHLATFLPGEPPRLSEPLADLALSPDETGELDLTSGVDPTHGGRTWVLAWRHVHVDRVGVSLAMPDASSLIRNGEPVDVSPTTTDVRHPDIAHAAGSTMVIWSEPDAIDTAIRAAVYSCPTTGP